MTELTVQGLGYTYPRGGVRALEGVELRIAPGERVAIVGQNGSGKTTLARHLNGLLRPTQGRLLVDGIDARRLSVAQLSKRVGLVFQDPDRQVFAASVHAEVAFGPRNAGLRGGRLADAIREALAMTGLADDERAHPYDLGLSRRKLLAIASVLAMRTPVLVLDEPTTGQDARGVERVRSVVAAVADERRTVIAISHDMRFVASTFERVVVMRAGRVVLDARTAEAFAARQWETLRSTQLEPPLAARLGERMGLGATPTDESLIAALAAQ